MAKLPDQYQERLTKVVAQLIPGFRKALDISCEFGVPAIRAPFTLKGYDEEFEVIIRPISREEPAHKNHPPSPRMIRTKAKALYVACHSAITRDASGAENDWNLIESEGEHGAYGRAYRGWIAAAREALS